MKKYFLLVTLFIDFGSFGQKQPMHFNPLLECDSEEYNSPWAIVFQAGDLKMASIIHLDAFLLLICPKDIVTRLNNNLAFNCAGVWPHEDDEIKKGIKEVKAVEEDTVVVLKASHANEKWSVSYTTPKAYGEKEVTLNCGDAFVTSKESLN